MEAHVCQGSIHKGKIVPYPSFLCSMCMGKNAVEVDMSKESIEAYNQKLLQKEEEQCKHRTEDNKCCVVGFNKKCPFGDVCPCPAFSLK